MNQPPDNGKRHEVLVEIGPEWLNSMTVWADPGMLEIIRSVPGVAEATASAQTEYDLRIDKRYDASVIAENITRAIMQEMERRKEQSGQEPEPQESESK